MADIKIKATPRTAYNPKRPPNALLLNQARELEKAVIAYGRKVRRRIPKTEEQVAAYMRHLNRALHQQIVLPGMKRRPVDVPLDELFPARRTRKTSGASKRRKTTRPQSKKKTPQARKRTRRS
jgi:hypothetical protein